MEEKSKKKLILPLKFLVQARHFSKPFPVYHVFTLSFELQLQDILSRCKYCDLT